MKKNLTIIGLVLMFGSVQMAWAESTALRTISKIKLNGYDNTYYFNAAEGGWGAPGCIDAQYVHIDSQNNLIAKEILSAALAARVANIKVVFDGDCVLPANEYFKAETIWIMDQ